MESISLVAPVRTPFLDERGNISRPWEVFLQTIARLLQAQATQAVSRIEAVFLPDGAGTTAIDITAPVTDGESLALVIVQGSTGGGQEITWGAAFHPLTSVDIDLNAGATNKIIFYGYQGLWYDFSRV